MKIKTIIFSLCAFVILSGFSYPKEINNEVEQVESVTHDFFQSLKDNNSDLYLNSIIESEKKIEISFFRKIQRWILAIE